MTVPASGRFTWHVNPSLRPSQYASAHLNESWTITCGPGNSGAKRTVELSGGARRDGVRRHEPVPARAEAEVTEEDRPCHRPRRPTLSSTR